MQAKVEARRSKASTSKARNSAANSCRNSNFFTSSPATTAAGPASTGGCSDAKEPKHRSRWNALQTTGNNGRLLSREVFPSEASLLWRNWPVLDVSVTSGRENKVRRARDGRMGGPSKAGSFEWAGRALQRTKRPLPLAAGGRRRRILGRPRHSEKGSLRVERPISSSTVLSALLPVDLLSPVSLQPLFGVPWLGIDGSFRNQPFRGDRRARSWPRRRRKQGRRSH